MPVLEKTKGAFVGALCVALVCFVAAELPSAKLGGSGAPSTLREFGRDIQFVFGGSK